MPKNAGIRTAKKTAEKKGKKRKIIGLDERAETVSYSQINANSTG
jgi:hypothetical protein